MGQTNDAADLWPDSLTPEQGQALERLVQLGEALHGLNGLEAARWCKEYAVLRWCILFPGKPGLTPPP